MSTDLLYSGFFVIYMALAMYSSIPSKQEKLARTMDIEHAKVPAYSPDSFSTGEPAWEKQHSQVRLNLPRTPVTAGMRNPMTPRTVAFSALEGGHGGPNSKALPFRERFGAPDGR